MPAMPYTNTINKAIMPKGLVANRWAVFPKLSIGDVIIFSDG